MEHPFQYLLALIVLFGAVGLILWAIRVFFRRSTVSDLWFFAVLFVVIGYLSYRAGQPEMMTAWVAFLVVRILTQPRKLR